MQYSAKDCVTEIRNRIAGEKGRLAERTEWALGGSG
jgi:hypothetical protein